MYGQDLNDVLGSDNHINQNQKIKKIRHTYTHMYTSLYRSGQGILLNISSLTTALIQYICVLHGLAPCPASPPSPKATSVSNCPQTSLLCVQQTKTIHWECLSLLLVIVIQSGLKAAGNHYRKTVVLQVMETR